MPTLQVTPLPEILAKVPDPRKSRGKRYELVPILLLCCVAVLCGYRSYGAIAKWGADYGEEWIRALGFSRKKTLYASSLYYLFIVLDWQKLEEALREWVESVIQAYEIPSEDLEGISVDGKSLRGSRKQGAKGVHLLGAMLHGLGVVLRQRKVDEKTNEIPEAPEFLRSLVLEGRVVTMDALLTQREVARTIVEEKGDYVMIVKKNQPELYESIDQLFKNRHMFEDTFELISSRD